MVFVWLIFRYLSQIKELKLTFQKTGKNLEIFCDSDWAGDKIDRQSFSGYVTLQAKGAVMKQQKAAVNYSVYSWSRVFLNVSCGEGNIAISELPERNFE